MDRHAEKSGMESKTYKTTDRISDVLADDYRLLQVMSRFGITFGFGDKTIGEVCAQRNVDAYTFVEVLNFVKGNGSTGKLDIGRLSVGSLLGYLRMTHNYFLEYQFPSLRRNMLGAIDCSERNEVAFLVLKFYDEYVEEVRKHMEYEERVSFTYVERLLSGSYEPASESAGNLMSRHHEHIELKLRELKNLFVQYYPQQEVNNELNAVIYELYRAQEDLGVHCHVEDCLFAPAVKKLAHLNSRKYAGHVKENTVPDDSENDKELSERERDIVVCVAKGMANKEIADHLCISVNTVTTHRRNIARKLSIHSSAGITIYAIVNQLVKLEDIKA